MTRQNKRRPARRCIACDRTGVRCPNLSPFHREGVCRDHRYLIYNPWQAPLSRERINELAWADWNHASERPKVASS